MAEALVPRKPPKFRPEQEVVVRGYLDGWRWTIIDARVGLPRLPGRKARSKSTSWLYTISAVRPHDGTVATQLVWQWRLVPAPAECIRADLAGSGGSVPETGTSPTPSNLSAEME